MVISQPNKCCLNILILNQYYPPDTSATATVCRTIAQTLAEIHRVTVLAGRPSYDPVQYHPYYTFQREVQDGVVVERVGSTAFPRRRMRKRLSNYLSYMAGAIPRALMIDADIILAMTDPPLAGIAGAFVACMRRRPFVYSIQDLHPDMALASGLVRSGFSVRIWEMLHRWALRRANLVIVLGEDMLERVIAKGVQAERVEVVRHGASNNNTMPPVDQNVSQEIRSGFPFAVVHAGNLGFYGAWETLVRAAKLLEQDDIGFIFVGDGAAKPVIKSLASACRNVRFLPFRPSEEIPYVLAAGDIHVVTISRGLEGMVVPSKLYPILEAGRPILAVASENSDVARIVTRNRCGIVVDPDNPVSVAEAVRNLMRNRGQLKEMSLNAQKVARQYERGKQLERYLELVEGVPG